MALDPRFAPLIAALSGKAADIVGSGGATPTPAQGGTPGTTTATPQVDAALTNPNTAAALAGANAQPGYGTSQPAQPSQLGGQLAPAAMSPEAAAQGAANAQTASELSMWDTILQNLTGRTPEGGMLSGDALKDFQQGHAIGGLLGALGAGIGGDTTGGRLGAAVYGQAAGGLAANNAERMQANQNDFMKAAMAALTGASQSGDNQQQPQGPAGPVTQPSRTQYNPMTSSTPTGGTTSQTQPGQLQDQSGTPTMASLDESLARMRRLSGIG